MSVFFLFIVVSFINWKINFAIEVKIEELRITGKALLDVMWQSHSQIPLSLGSHEISPSPF